MSNSNSAYCSEMSGTSGNCTAGTGTACSAHLGKDFLKYLLIQRLQFLQQ
jgi:hypothetical protein